MGKEKMTAVGLVIKKKTNNHDCSYEYDDHQTNSGTTTVGKVIIITFRRQEVINLNTELVTTQEQNKA